MGGVSERESRCGHCIYCIVSVEVRFFFIVSFVLYINISFCLPVIFDAILRHYIFMDDKYSTTEAHSISWGTAVPP